MDAKLHIQNLVDLLHACLLLGELDRARRAWAILIRCREVDWKERWYWGLALFSSTEPNDSDPTQTQSRPFSQELTYRAAQDEGRDAERWLRTLRVSAKEADRPALLHALVLHLIKHSRYRDALDELETYLTSYPYLLSSSLHTYAGLLSFYLSYPESARHTAHVSPSQAHQERTPPRTLSPSSSRSPSAAPPASDRGRPRAPTNPILLAQARAWFVQALELDPEIQVAKEFIKMIDAPYEEAISDDGLMEMDEDDEDKSDGNKSDQDKSDDQDSTQSSHSSPSTVSVDGAFDEDDVEVEQEDEDEGMGYAESSTTDTEGGTTVDPLANDAVLVDFVGLALDSGLFIGVEKKSLPSPEEYEEPGENTLEPVSRLEPRWAWAYDDRGRFPDPETDPETETETDAGMSLRCRSRPDVDLRREMDVGSIAIAGSVSLRLPISGRIERGREFCRACCGLSPRPSPTPYLCIEGEG
ncbi:hypothetical protein EHS25_005008 [Saitozyma podzolica]|uniref:Uncharacterized protein n=1 Tax=Saitozyma podzolica TaxID=1890683 RepID=A0A427Y296_9TREE|nr:hypothetical protein EHS25_005008 [Saitozyma podzolica]